MHRDCCVDAKGAKARSDQHRLIRQRGADGYTCTDPYAERLCLVRAAAPDLAAYVELSEERRGC